MRVNLNENSFVHFVHIIYYYYYAAVLETPIYLICLLLIAYMQCEQNL